MCDTFHLPSGEQRYFGKNSDRNPKEVQVVRQIARRNPSDSAVVGGRRLCVPDAGYAMVLSCPTWMEGAEMGVNEKGVAIGNEAVFSKFPAAPDGVLGMDFLKAALMAAGSAAEARDALIALTEGHEQGGNGALKGKLVYDNSYLISGFDGAYILETAGKRWAWRELEGPAAISNAYSIQADYKRLDPASRKSIAPVNERMACLDEADAGRIADKESWKAYVEKGFKPRLMARLSAGDARRAAIEPALMAAADTGGRQAAFSILRAHGLSDPATPGKGRNVCCHDRDLWGNASTASMLLERGTDPSRFVVWFTSASYPCSNLFKPILYDGGFKPLWDGFDTSGEAYWTNRRDALRKVAANPAAGDAHAAALSAAQDALGAIVDTLIPGADEMKLAAAKTDISQLVASWDV
jgi:secernin